MATISGRITLFITVLCAVAALVQNLGIMPTQTNTAPMLDFKDSFNFSATPGKGFSDDMMATYGWSLQSVGSALAAIVTAPLVLLWMPSWGIDAAFVLFAQGIIACIYALDVLFIMTGRQLL